ncbi:carboxypeptidase-like regulatory domain-containing protein [Capnocytophaga stomatis]|uniref:carboxypeptidase-like regulatory domain-containing protein n=1 Tax=Capnocytophaga stomatis TaxID=1848904 RepID=UPI001BB3ED54|nr:carboxypeptidase-like regulatory domain-containing protein [Capnocytophaga stomatis]
MYRIFYFCLMMLLSAPVFSQSVVEGTVVDYQTKEVLQNVKIVVEETSIESFTDSNGYFSIQLAEGSYVFRFSLNGFNEMRMPINASSPKITISKIYLEPDLAREAEQLVVISETELEDDESGADMISGLLQSSQDIFMRRAAYDFSSVFFKPRGYDSKDVTVLINGIPMNRVENGRAQWANWGGLNDVTRNQELSQGINKSDYTFGGMSGSNYINVRPSLNRTGLRFSTSAGNRSYVGRIMATYNSGIQSNGLAYSLSASRRWAANGSWVDGTLYNAYSFFGALEYQFNNHHSINAIGMFSPIRRGKTSPLTREVIDLMGYQYNPYWGKQGGDIRNSRNRIVSEPIFVLSYNYNKDNTRLNIDLGYQFGKIGNTRLSYANAQNPEPNYYKNLPSYYINQESGANWNLVNLQKEYFLNNSQLNWNSIYYANSNTTNGRSAFIISNDVNDERTFTGNINFSTPIHEKIKWTSGIVYRNISSENYAEVDDLLGGSHFMNYDYFANKPYDANDTNFQKKVGDKWSYFYGLKSNVGEFFTQLEFNFKKLELFVAGRYHYTDYQREGKFNYPLFADSYGKSTKQTFNGVSTKAGLTYALTGRHVFQLNTGYLNTPQSVRNTFANIRNSNRLLPNLKNETAYTVDGSYILRMPYFKSRLTGYFTHIENTSETNFFFTETTLTDEISSDFVSQTVDNIKKRHFGLEFGAEAQIIPTLKLTAVAAIGQHTYVNNPKMYVSSGEIGVVEIDQVHLKNYRVPSGPQQAYSLGLEYRDPKYWWIGATANLLARNYISLSAINRTRNFFIDPDTKNYFTNIDKTLARNLLKQERLDDVFLLNIVGGKSWRVKKTYISLIASINNVLGKEFVSGGFEQSRTANYGDMVRDNANGVPSFGPRYFVGYGRTYMVNLAVSM